MRFSRTPRRSDTGNLESGFSLDRGRTGREKHYMANMERSKIIGIVGGVGPYAGLDLSRKVFDQTLASRDQDHLGVILISWSDLIPDRTEFLLGREKKNPGMAIVRVIGALEAAGAEVIGIPCNTAHSPEIFRVIQQIVGKNGKRVKILHMVEEVAAFVKMQFPAIRKVGILGTNGTILSDVYAEILEREALEVFYPTERTQVQKVHKAIYDEKFGVKAQSFPVTEKARQKILEAMGELVGAGCEALILACTELPLAIPENVFAGRPVIDATVVLARALVREAAPNKLKKIRPLRRVTYKQEPMHCFRSESVQAQRVEKIYAPHSRSFSSGRFA